MRRRVVPAPPSEEEPAPLGPGGHQRMVRAYLAKEGKR
jgi:hypothetical protein